MGDWTVGNQAALAIAEVLKQSRSLVHFEMRTRCLTKEAGPLFEGLEYSSLKKLEVLLYDHLEDEPFDSELIANAVRNNTSLESLVLHYRVHYFDLDVLVDAFAKNTSITSTRITCDQLLFHDSRMGVLKLNRRNVELRKICFVLAQLAKPSDAFNSLTNAYFRQMVFSFFLPPDCKPAQIFRDLGMVGTPSSIVLNQAVVERHADITEDLEVSVPAENMNDASLNQEVLEEQTDVIEDLEVSALAENMNDTIEQEKHAILNRRFLVLEYNKGSKKFDDVLMGSQLAVDSASRGAELQPQWGNGAKIFAEGISMEQLQDFSLGNRHVIIRPEDEETLQAMLFQLKHSDRPKLKPVKGRATVEGSSSSLQTVASESRTGNSVDNPTGVYLFDDLDPIPFVINRTFIELPNEPEAIDSLRRSSSMPSL